MQRSGWVFINSKDKLLPFSSAKAIMNSYLRVLPRPYKRFSSAVAAKLRCRLTFPRVVKEEVKELAKISFPVTVFNFVIFCRSMVSLLFLGHLGSLELAGGALALSFASITENSILYGLASGMDPICSQAFGSENWELVGLAMQRTILILLLACVPISILWINMQNIYLFFGQDASITAVAGTFILYAIPDLIAESVLEALRVYLRCHRRNRPMMWCSVLALAFHILINVILVRIFKLGVPGVAISWAWTNFNLVLFIIIYIQYSGSCKKTWTGWSSASLQEWWPLLKLSLPSCLSICLDWWWYEIITLLAGYLPQPKAAIAAAAILIQTTCFMYTFSLAHGSAVSTRVGHELGANHPRKARRAALVGLSWAFLNALMSVTWTSIFRNQIGRKFTDDAEILVLTTAMIPLIGLCELGNCPQTAGCGILRGTAKVKFAATINFICFYLLGIPVAVALAFWKKIGFPGLWIGLLSAQISCAVSVLCVILRIDWREEALKAQQLTGNSMLENSGDEMDDLADTNTVELIEEKPLLTEKGDENSQLL